MELIAIVLSILTVSFSIIALIFTIITNRNNKPKMDMTRELRSYIKENRAQFGVSNHGTSMDSVEQIYVVSPKKMGIKERD